MTSEEKFVVNQLVEYFEDRTRCPAKWHIKHRPKHGKSATGWDLQVERKNQVLLIEAKYITRSFASAISGLILAPLCHRPEKMKRALYRSWSARICWAIGCGYKNEKHRKGFFQILFDYIARNLSFWNSYAEILGVKYVFFIDGSKVAKIRFQEMVKLVGRYYTCADEPLEKRRLAAEKLVAKKLNFK
jgi:hypothetical protein